MQRPPLRLSLLPITVALLSGCEGEGPGAEEVGPDQGVVERPLPDDLQRSGPALARLTPASGAPIDGPTEVVVEIAADRPLLRIAATGISADGQPRGEIAATTEGDTLRFTVDPELHADQGAVHVVIVAIDEAEEMMHLRVRYPLAQAGRLYGRMPGAPVHDLYVVAHQGGDPLAEAPVAEDGAFEISPPRGLEGPLTLEIRPGEAGTITDPSVGYVAPWDPHVVWQTEVAPGQQGLIALGPLTSLAVAHGEGGGLPFVEAAEAVADHFGLRPEALIDASAWDRHHQGVLGCLAEQGRSRDVVQGAPLVVWSGQLMAALADDGRADEPSLADPALGDVLRGPLALSCARWAEGPASALPDLHPWHLGDEDFVSWLEDLSLDVTALSAQTPGVLLWEAPAPTVKVEVAAVEAEEAGATAEIHVRFSAESLTVGLRALTMLRDGQPVSTWPANEDPRLPQRHGELALDPTEYAEGATVEIEAEAIDLLGRSTRRVERVALDGVAPRFRIQAPTGGLLIEGTVHCAEVTCLVPVYVEDAQLVAVEATLGNVRVPLLPPEAPGAPYMVALQAQADGEDRLRLRAEDASGHVSEVWRPVVFDLSPPSLSYASTYYTDEAELSVDAEGRRVMPDEAQRQIPLVSGVLLRRWQSSWALAQDPVNPIKLLISVDEGQDLPELPPQITARFRDGDPQPLTVSRRPGGLWAVEIAGPAIGLDPVADLGLGMPLDLTVVAEDRFGRVSEETLRFVVEVMVGPAHVEPVVAEGHRIEAVDFDGPTLQALVQPQVGPGGPMILSATRISNPHAEPMWVTLPAPEPVDVTWIQQLQISGAHLPSLAHQMEGYDHWDIRVGCLDPILNGMWINASDRFAVGVRGRMVDGAQIFEGGACEALEATAGRFELSVETAWWVAEPLHVGARSRLTEAGGLEIRMAPGSEITLYRVPRPSAAQVAPLARAAVGGPVAYADALQGGEVGLFNHVPALHCAEGESGCPEGGPWYGRRVVLTTGVSVADAGGAASIDTWATCPVDDQAGCGAGGRASGRLDPIAGVSISRPLP